jgi:hypothetical protein
MSGDRWDDIADRVSTEASAVECSASEYRDGLRIIIERLEVDLQASRELDKEGDE